MTQRGCPGNNARTQLGVYKLHNKLSIISKMETLTRAKDAAFKGMSDSATYVASSAVSAKDTVVNSEFAGTASATAASAGSAIATGAVYAKDSVVSGATSAATYVAKLWAKNS